MARIQLGGAGGAPTNNFIKSLKVAQRQDYLIGTSSSPSDLFLADVNERHVVPPANHPLYPEKLIALISQTKPDFMHAQHDFEVRALSRMRKQLSEYGIKLYLPDAETIENCVDKERSYNIWLNSGVTVPKTMILNTEQDLKNAFADLGTTIWLRAIEGGGGYGALPTTDFALAKAWIERFNGWGKFTAAELLSKNTITWQSLWYEGELVVAQTRKRRSWNFGDRTLSGVTGITGVGETCSIKEIDQLAQDAIFAVSQRPHGIFSVDMTYSFSGKAHVTEINIGRFFTTHYFFTKAGLNFPEIYCDIALENKFPTLEQKINPLKEGLIWIRGMDIEPVLTTADELSRWEAIVC